MLKDLQAYAAGIRASAGAEGDPDRAARRTVFCGYDFGDERGAESYLLGQIRYGAEEIQRRGSVTDKAAARLIVQAASDGLALLMRPEG